MHEKLIVCQFVKKFSISKEIYQLDANNFTMILFS